jgi:PmbA protein
LKKFMERVLNELTDNKAEGDLIYSASKSLKMSSQKGALSEYKVSSSQILGVRAIKEGRVGISYSEAMDDESISFMIKEALSNAESSNVNPHEKIMDLIGELHDRASYEVSDPDMTIKTEKALSLESRVREADPRVKAVPYNSYSENEFESEYMSTKGRFTSYGDKSYTITSSALMEEQGKKANFYDYHSAHCFAELDWDQVIERSLFHAGNLLQEKMLPTGKYNITFTEDCLRDLMGCFSNFYSGKSSMDKMNPWANRLGEEVMSSDLTIIDDPQFKGCFRESFFDSEGVEQKPLTLVKDGVLEEFYHNSLTGNYFGTPTNARASRAPSSSLSVSGTNMILLGRNPKPAPRKYLEVIQMDGLYSGANRVNGSFSVAVKGYLYENGERKMTFGNCTLSGNIIELLRKAEVTGTLVKGSKDRTFFTVPLVFHELSIAGS